MLDADKRDVRSLLKIGDLYAKKGAKAYRYYVCVSAQKNGWATCPTKSLPAGTIEDLVVKQVRRICQDPGLVTNTLEETETQRIEQLFFLVFDARVEDVPIDAVITTIIASRG